MLTHGVGHGLDTAVGKVDFVGSNDSTSAILALRGGKVSTSVLVLDTVLELVGLGRVLGLLVGGLGGVPGGGGGVLGGRGGGSVGVGLVGHCGSDEAKSNEALWGKVTIKSEKPRLSKFVVSLPSF